MNFLRIVVYRFYVRLIWKTLTAVFQSNKYFDNDTWLIMALDFLYRQFPYVLTMCRAKSRQGTKYIDDDSFENVSTNGKIILGSKSEKYII